MIPDASRDRYEDQWSETEELKEETTLAEQGDIVAHRKKEAADAFEDGESNPNRSKPHPNDTKTGAFKRANPNSNLSTFEIWETVEHGGVGESGYDNAMDAYLAKNDDVRLPGGESNNTNETTMANTTPTGSDNPFNWNTDDSGNVDVPSRLTDEPTQTYEYDYDYGGTADDPLNDPVEQAREDARDLNITLQGQTPGDSNGSMLGALAVVAAIAAVVISLFGGD